ncbi:MAG: InlB B-repeat-containing protein [Alloprevotella sp.]
MKKSSLRVWALWLWCLALIPSTLAAQAYWDGTYDAEWEGEGTAEAPYLITSATELAGLAQRTNADETFEGVHFRLTCDIYLSNPDTPDDEKPLWEPIGSYTLGDSEDENNPGDFYAKEHWFKGSFDGDGHTIYNLWYTGVTNYDDWNDPFGSGQLDFTAWHKTLFGLTDGADIRNLRLENANVAGTALIGGLVIRAKNSRFADIHVSGHIKSGDIENGGSAAALAVEAENCHFEGCTSSASVFARSNTGGLIGKVSGASTVVNCSANGEVTGCVSVGGLIGVSARIQGDETGATPVVRLSSSAATVTIITGRDQGNDGAGFIGLNEGTITQCSATGTVNLRADAAAGFCYDNRGLIASCYSTADVTSDNYGCYLAAFVGNNGLDVGYEKQSGTLWNCYGTGRVYAPEPPTDLITTGTHLCGFSIANYTSAGAYMANCYYNSTSVPEIETPGQPGEYGRPTAYLQSREFADSLNYMAALMGTHLWQYNEGAYPTPTDVLATDVTPFLGGGAGTEAEPFLVNSKQHLENVAYAANRNWEFRGQHLLQTADIALNAPRENWGEQMPTMWTPIAVYGGNEMNEWSHHFSGTYDGGFHTVQNMYIDGNAGAYAGLFGVLGSGAVVRRLGVVDAWMSGSNNMGILVGGTNVQNDPCAEGPRTISQCWTSGLVNGGEASGGIVGRSWANAGEDFTMVACYSTAEANRGLIGENGANGTNVIGSWFGGKVPNRYGNAFAFAYTDGYYRTYVDCDKNPVREQDTQNYPFGRPTADLQSKQFVNELNYAAAVKGYEGGWGYNEGAYPSFAGIQPTAQVTLDDGISAPVTFLALEGSTLVLPTAAEREGYTLEGWYTDAEYSEAFHFGENLVTEPVTLYARWTQPVEADYEVFKNRFATTYTLTTAKQLYALANIVNGTAEGVDQSDFSGKTVKLGADIELNDVSWFDLWGNSVTPQRFPSIANDESYPFNGTFDGQGHVIRGLFITCLNPDNDKYGLFGYLGADAEVQNVILEKACILKERALDAGLLAANSKGKVTRCGAEGKIISPIIDTYTVNGGLIGVAENSSSVSECYALVDMDVRYDRCGGLVGTLKGTLDNSFARGSVRYSASGGFGGVVSSFEGEAFTNCYSAVTVSFGNQPTTAIVGGSYGSAPWNATVNPGIYDRDLVSAAFDQLADAIATTAYNQGTGQTTVDMKKIATYTGWDFNTVWGRRNDQNEGYPYLRWTAPGQANDADNVIEAIQSIPMDTNEQVEIFTPDGLLIYSGTWAGAHLNRGVYILRSNSRTFKVMKR